MKINEIPEKIYLDYELDEDKIHIFINYMWHRHPFFEKNLQNVEYTRTETFLDKVCEFFEKRMKEMKTPDGNAYVIDGESLSISEFIRNFKEYIKEQQ